METTPIPPFVFFARNQPSVQLRKHLIGAKWRQLGTMPRKAGYLAVVAGWPVISGFLAWRESRHFGAEASKYAGRSTWNQFFEQWWIACWYGLAPHAYYKYGVFNSGARANARDYLHNQELAALVYEFNRGKDVAMFGDKMLFDRECERHGIAHIPTLGVFEDGVALGPVKCADDLPHVDLFAKPVNGAVGVGARRWILRPDGTYERNNGEVHTRQQVFDSLVDSSRKRSVLLQPRVLNHPELMPLSSGGLCTTRIVTGKRVSGEVVLLGGVYKMTTRTNIADNFAAGGIGSRIDPESGRLGPAAGKKMLSERLDYHPDTGQRIAGVTLPLWPQTKQACLDAHRRLTDVPLIGWDVAITRDGPVLVEGNYEPCLELFQKGTDSPVGGSLFNNFCLEWFAALQKRG